MHVEHRGHCEADLHCDGRRQRGRAQERRGLNETSRPAQQVMATTLRTPGLWTGADVHSVTLRKMQLEDERSLPRDRGTEGGLECWERAMVTQGQVSAPEHGRQVTQRL